MDKDSAGRPAGPLSSSLASSLDNSLLCSFQNILLAELGIEGNRHMGTDTRRSLSSLSRRPSVVENDEESTDTLSNLSSLSGGPSMAENDGESIDTPHSSSSSSGRPSIVEKDGESTDSVKLSTNSVSGQGNGSVWNLLKGVAADRRIGVVGSSGPGIVENDGGGFDSLKNPIGSVSDQGKNFVPNPQKGVIGNTRIGVVGSSGPGIVENNGESTDSLKNLISSVSGQGNGSVRNVPKSVIGDRRIRVVGSSRLGIVENNGESTDSMTNPIGSVSGQGNGSVRNMPKVVVGDSQIEGMGSAQIPMVETDNYRSTASLMGYPRSGKCVEDTKTDFSFLPNSISLSAGHGNGSAQNLSQAVVSERSSQLETAGIDGQGIGRRLFDLWDLHDHNNGINSTGSTRCLENPTQGLPFCGDSHGISISDYLNSISDRPNSSMGLNNEVLHGENRQCYYFNGLENLRLRNHIPENPTMVTAGLDYDLISTSAVIPDYIAPIAGNNLWGPCSSVVGQTPFVDGQNGYIERAGCCSSSGIARNPTVEGHFEALSNMLFQSHFGLAFPDPCSWEQLQDDEIHSMARNIIGCKHLLKILEQGDLVATKKILGVTLGSMDELMAHESGNKLFQKLLDSCNASQIFEIVHRVTAQAGALINAAKERYGTRSVQKLIRKVKRYSPLVTSVTSALAPGIVSLMVHPFGFDVFQHCLIHLNDHQNTFIHEAAMEHCLTLGTHVKGCISLTEYLNHSKSTRRQVLLRKITELSLCLSQDPYGNYVVGVALQLEIPEVIFNICRQLKGHYVHLSTQKFGSFVVQKCLVRWTAFVVLDLLASGKLDQLAFDPYGNYVIQTALEMTEGVLKLHLIDVLRPHSQSLQFHLHGRKIFHLISGS